MLRILHMINWLFVSAMIGCSGTAATVATGGESSSVGGNTGNNGGTSATAGSNTVTVGTATGGSSGITGGTTASTGGVSASGGSSGITSGTSMLDCHFTYTNRGTTPIADCHVSGDSQHSCADAAACICSDLSRKSSCYAFYMSPHGSASFTDFCAHSTTATSTRSLAEALSMMAASENTTVSTSEDCSRIRAIL